MTERIQDSSKPSNVISPGESPPDGDDTASKEAFLKVLLLLLIDEELQEQDSGPEGGPGPSNMGEGEQVGTAKGTGYYPSDDPVEGGFVDMKGNKLNTLQDYLEGNADYVSIALDQELYDSGAVQYGDTFRIPELEEKYGQPIVFKAVDTGPSFQGQGFGAVDICTRTEQDTFDETINGNLTLMKLD